MTDSKLPVPLRHRLRRGHTLIELVTASVSSGLLLVGLGSVMFIASKTADTPALSSDRVNASAALQELANELRFATFLLERRPDAIEFVVADRDGDGSAERIRYELYDADNTQQKSLRKSVNGNAPVTLIESTKVSQLTDFQLSWITKEEPTTFTPIVESSEGLLVGTSMAPSPSTGITSAYWLARRIDPSLFPASIGGINKAAATSWNATRARFYARSVINPNAGTVYLQLRSTGSPGDLPTSAVVGQVTIPEAQLPAAAGWHNANFAGAAQGLTLHRKYALVWEGARDAVGNHAQLATTGSGSHVAVTEGAEDIIGGTWTATPMEIFFQLYGTYTSLGEPVSMNRTFATHVSVSVTLRSGDPPDQRVSQIDSSFPLLNRPELLSAYWRADFDTGIPPTAIDLRGDGLRDWIVPQGGQFDAKWLATQPRSNFSKPTIVEVRCRARDPLAEEANSGAELRIRADQQPSSHARLIVRLRQQADSQTLTLLGESSEASDVVLFKRDQLPRYEPGDPSSGFVQYRLTILPDNDLVNLSINGHDEGTYKYPTYSPADGYQSLDDEDSNEDEEENENPPNDDRFLAFRAYSSSAEYDYVELRVAE